MERRGSDLSGYDQVLEELGLDVKLHDEVLAAVDRTFRDTVGAQKNRPEAMSHFDEVPHESHGGRVVIIAEAFDSARPGRGVAPARIIGEVVENKRRRTYVE